MISKEIVVNFDFSSGGSKANWISVLARARGAVGGLYSTSVKSFVSNVEVGFVSKSNLLCVVDFGEVEKISTIPGKEAMAHTGFCYALTSN